MTALIERLPETETKVGVSVGALYAYGNGSFIVVNGEMKASAGTALPDDLRVLVSFFDAGGRMLDSTEHWVEEDGVELEPFSLTVNLDDDAGKVVRIRVMPRRG
jgi:hypothetical protein